MEEYIYGFRSKDVSVFRTERGLTRQVVEEISRQKNEPEWMLERRLKALDIFYSKPMPQWGVICPNWTLMRLFTMSNRPKPKEEHGMKFLKRSRKRLINSVSRRRNKNI